MKFNVILIIVIIILIGLTSLSEANVIENKHYIVVGHVYPSYESNYITIENIRTMEILKIQLIDCEHELKEYLFDLANLKQGWNKFDKIIITYDNNSYTVMLNNPNGLGYQQDFNAPIGYIPIAIVSGTILIAVGTGYYIKYGKEQTKKKCSNIKNMIIIVRDKFINVINKIKEML